MSIVDRLHKLAGKELVDVSGGTDNILSWASEIKWKHYHHPPEVVVLILKKVGDKYRGALYLTKEDFLGGKNE